MTSRFWCCFRKKGGREDLFLYFNGMNNSEHHISQIHGAWGKTIEQAGLLPIIPSKQPMFDFLWRCSLQDNQRQSKSILKLEMLTGYNPTPKRFLEIPLHQFLELGVHPKKAQLLRTLSQQATDGGVGWPSKNELLEDDEDVLVAKWTRNIKGLNPVHLERYLIFGVGRKNVFSSQDPDARLGYQQMMQLQEPMSSEEWGAVRKDCHPYGTLGMRCLWWHAKRVAIKTNPL